MKRALICGLLLLVFPGCIVVLEGGGKAGVGYDHTGEVYVYHEATPDLVDARSRSEVDLTPLTKLLGALGWLEPTDKQPTEPSTGPEPE